MNNVFAETLESFVDTQSMSAYKCVCSVLSGNMKIIGSKFYRMNIREIMDIFNGDLYQLCNIWSRKKLASKLLFNLRLLGTQDISQIQQHLETLSNGPKNQSAKPLPTTAPPTNTFTPNSDELLVFESFSDDVLACIAYYLPLSDNYTFLQINFRMFSLLSQSNFIKNNPNWDILSFNDTRLRKWCNSFSDWSRYNKSNIVEFIVSKDDSRVSGGKSSSVA